jgi:hypothetical protein
VGAEDRPKPVTIGELVRSVLDEASGGGPVPVPSWPPDVFAVVATVLKRTGTYLALAGLPKPVVVGKKGNDEVQEVAKKWREHLAGTSTTIPSEITRWWQTITEGSNWPADELLDAIRDEQERRHDEAMGIITNLFRLFMTADEVSHGAGFLTLGQASADAADSFELRCAKNLSFQWWPVYPSPLSSLCEKVHPTRAIVLPKIHVPQSGLTLNNLTRNLAFCDSGADIAPVWRWIVSPYHQTHKREGINLLLIPYPLSVHPSSFKRAKRRAIDASASYFSSEPGGLTREDHQRVLAAAELVAERHGRLDAVVLPETATDYESFEQLCRNLMWWSSSDRVRRGGVVVVGGVGRSSAAGDFGENKAAVSFDLAGFRVAPGNQQSKHHRWRLDRGQIDQYGLGAQLDPRKVWWEYIALPQRAIYFWAAGWLTMSVLICEDLARQEPVVEIVRAVGPNLVIALLADGPQLEKRWSARYATVLADDPGCSVLTLTSLGMTKLSKQPRNTESRVIALWKDAKSGAVEIELPHGAFGLVLSITRESASANTADGRTGKKQARLHLSGVHPIMMADVDNLRACRKSSESSGTTTTSGHS